MIIRSFDCPPVITFTYGCKGYSHNSTYLIIPVNKTCVVAFTYRLSCFSHNTTYLNIPVNRTCVVAFTYGCKGYSHNTTYLNIPVNRTCVVTPAYSSRKISPSYYTTYFITSRDPTGFVAINNRRRVKSKSYNTSSTSTTYYDSTNAKVLNCCTIYPTKESYHT